jgi:hypothetical protein
MSNVNTLGTMEVYKQVQEKDVSIVVDTPGDEKEQLVPGNKRKGYKNIIWSKEDDMYFSLTSQEIRINIFRAFMKVVSILVFFSLYYMLWNWYAMITFVVAIASCTLSCIGMPYLCSSCYAGVLVSLLHGVRIGNELIHVDVKWKA